MTAGEESVRRIAGSAAVAIVAAALIAASLIAVVLWPAGPGPAGRQRADLLRETDAGGSYAIGAPAGGDITDGGLVLRAARSAVPALVSARLFDHRSRSALRLVQAMVVPVAPGLDQAVGVRSGLPAALAGQLGLRPLAGQRITGSGYEVLLGVRAPAGAGTWHVTGIALTYRAGGLTQSQTFPHELTVCVADRSGCGPVGSHTVTLAAASHRVGQEGACAGLASYVSGRPARVWVATSVSSAWQGSGGTISLAQTKTASFTRSTLNSTRYGESATFGYNWLTVTASAEQLYRVTLTQQSQTSQTWTYSITVPANAPTARVTVYTRGWALPVTTVVDKLAGGRCDAVYTYGLVYAPDRYTSYPADYCIALQFQPPDPVLGPQCHSR
jgi:hypothetical protein